MYSHVVPSVGGLVRVAGGYGERAAQQAEGIDVPPSRTRVDSGIEVKTETLSESWNRWS